MLENLKIHQKLYGLAGLCVAASTVIALIGYWGVSVLMGQLGDNTQIASALRNHIEADMMHDALRGDVLTALRLGQDADEDQRAEIAEQLSGHVEWFQSRISANQELDLPGDVRSALDAVGPALDTYIKSAENIVKLAVQDTSAANVEFASFMESFGALEINMAEVSVKIESVSRATGTAGNEIAWWARNLLLIVSFVAIVVAGAVSFLLIRQISLPLVAMTRAMGRLAEGDNSIEIPAAERKDEVGEMAKAVQVFKDNMIEADSLLSRSRGLEHEITERKAAEVALRESEQALQDRVAQLEEARRRLERQGEDLVCMAEDLGFARDQAEAANHAKSEFLASMSHELRTPLNAIIGFSEIIKGETFGPVGSDKYRDYASDIHESGYHLLALINDILDLSKVESGFAELQEEDVGIHEFVRSVTTMLAGRAEKGAVALELDVPDDVPALRIDRRRLKQILVNLLSNAIKFTPGGGTVTLKIWSRAESGYVFQVIDTGIGIAVADIPRALAPFQQIDSGLNRKHEGTGLGLPLTNSLVEMHGGYLDLQSEVGAGTTVTVRFPAERIVPWPRDAKAVGAAYKKAG
jgi:signal transduction histidine kinase